MINIRYFAILATFILFFGASIADSLIKRLPLDDSTIPLYVIYAVPYTYQGQASEILNCANQDLSGEEELVSCNVAGGIPNALLSYGPTAAYFSNYIWVPHAGIFNNDQIWVIQYDLTSNTWVLLKEYQGTGTATGGVGSIVNGANLMLLYFNVGDNQLYYFSIYYTGSKWTYTARIPVSSSAGKITGSATPNAVFYNSNLYVFYQTVGLGGGIWYTTSNSGLSSWSVPVQIYNTGMSNSPSPVVVNNLLYVFHQGGANNGQLWYNVFDGTNWAGDTQITEATLAGSSGPAAVFIPELSQIYVFYVNSDNALIELILDSTTNEVISLSPYGQTATNQPFALILPSTN